jgi:hypothetical protein
MGEEQWEGKIVPEDPIRKSPTNGETASSTIPSTGGENIEAELQREVERLRMQLAKVTAEAESYRRAAYALLNKQFPYAPPNEAELNDLLHGPRGRSILEILEKLERKGGG